MQDIAEQLARASSEGHLAIDEITDAARVLLRAQTEVDRRIALERLDAARGRLDSRLAALRGSLVRVFLLEGERDEAEGDR